MQTLIIHIFRPLWFARMEKKSLWIQEDEVTLMYTVISYSDVFQMFKIDLLLALERGWRNVYDVKN